MAASTFSTTSYAILGYLSIRPWTAYDLAKQMGRTFHHFWPRAESGIYREVKRLVEGGLAVSSEDPHGKRPRTRYEISEAGRDALRSWLSAPQSDGFLESEAMVRLLFSDQATTQAITELLDAMTQDVRTRSDQMAQVMQDYLVTGGQFPQRAHINVLIARFLVDFAAMVHDWAEWSTAYVGTWPDAHERELDDAARDRIRETIAAATAIGTEST
jgi:PadR family transcriptional regulator, regulatory protein AphA